VSSNLIWVPIVHSKQNDLSDKFKFVLEKRYDLADDIRMDASDIDYLQGILDCGIDDAEKVIRAIREHGEIALSLVY